MIDDVAALVEAQHGGTGKGQPPAILDPRAPPLNGSAVAADNRVAEPALDLRFDVEVPLQIVAHARDSLIGIAECQRAISRFGRVEGRDGVDVLARPSLL